MSVEEIFQNPVGSFILSGLVFFIQLYARSSMAEIKKNISEGRSEAKTRIIEAKGEVKDELVNTNANIQMLYTRINATDNKVTRAVTEIENIKEAIKEIKCDCKENHR